MNKLKLFISLIVITLFVSGSNAFAFREFDIPYLNNPSPGYIFTGPMNWDTISLYDNSGHPAYYKSLGKYDVAFTALRVLENGLFAFYGMYVHKWYIVDKNFDVIDSIAVTKEFSTNFHTLHVSPQGHYLLLGDTIRTIDMSGVVPNGRQNAYLFDNVIQEFDENKKLVFQWDCYDHIDVRDATEEIDLTSISIDPYHVNQVVFDTDGNILVNFRNLDEIYKIDRSNGSIKWIWGGSKSRRNQFTFTNDSVDGFTGFSHQHDPKRLANGNILLFDNAVLNQFGSSRAVEYSLNETTKTATKVWEYHYPTPYHAEFMGNAQRLANGNTMIGWGVTKDTSLSSLSCTEVTPDGVIAFEMRTAGSCFYQVLRHVYNSDAVVIDINSTGNKSFNDTKNKTGVSININSFTSSNQLTNVAPTSVEKHYYGPLNVDYETTQACSYLPYRWVINSTGLASFSGRISFDLSTIPDIRHRADLKIYWRPTESAGKFSQLTTTYVASTNKIEADITSFGEFILAYNTTYQPILYYPRNDTTQVQLSTMLQWIGNTTQDKYRLQVSLTSSYANPIVDSMDIEKSEFYLTDLAHYTNYYWRVKAYSKTCEGNWSYSNMFRTIIGEPDQIYPTDQMLNQSLSGSLKWAVTKGADKYKVQISQDTSFKKLLVDTTISNYTFYNYHDFKYNSTYYWRVSAGSFGRYGLWSTIWMFSTYIGKPLLLLPVNQDIGIEVKGTLEWRPLPNAKSYHLQLCKDTIFDNNVYDVKDITTTTFNFEGLEKSTQYFWRVVATDNTSKSEWSDIWRFWTIFPQPILQLPENNSINTAINGQLTWKPVPTASTYKVQLSTDPDFINVVLNQETYYPNLKFSGLQFEKPYFWRVKASNGNLESEWSEMFSFTTQPKDLLVSPSIIYPRNEEFKVPVNLEVIWNEAYSADSYDIQIATDPAFKNIVKTADDVSLTRYQITDLDYNIFYYIKMRAKNAKMTSGWSQPVRFTTWMKTPKVIYPLDNDTNSVITEIFKWEPSQDAKYYSVQVAKDPAFEVLVIDQDNLENTQYDFSGKLEGVYYYWHVASANNVNGSDWSPTGKLKMLLNVSVHETLESIDSFSVYPIPVTSDSKINLRITKPQYVTINVIDELGVVLFTVISQELDRGDYIYDLPADNLASGVYYCRLNADKGSMIKKFQVVK